MEGKEKEEEVGVASGQKEELIARLVLGTFFFEKRALRARGGKSRFPRTPGSKKKK